MARIIPETGRLPNRFFLGWRAKIQAAQGEGFFSAVGSLIR